MANWNEVERVKRDGEDVVKKVNGHTMVKVFRLRNGSRYDERGGLNVGTNSSIPKEERRKRTAWKCDKCGVEVGGSAKSVYGECSE